MSETEPFVVRYGIMVIRRSDENTGEILHFCGYEEPPRREDFEALREELSTDEEFGLTSIMNEVRLVEAPPEIVEIYRQIVKE